MDQVIVNKKIPFSVKTQFGFPFMVASSILVYLSLYFLPFLILSILLRFTNYAYEFNKNLNHRLLVKVFGITVFGYKKKFINPDYISLFNQPLKTSMVSGFMEIGVARYKEFAIKLFKGNINETVLRSTKREEVILLGSSLANLFNVEVYNNLK